VSAAPSMPSSDPGGTIRTDVIAQAALLLLCSNVFMTFAWYAHLQNQADRPWYVAVYYMRQPIELDYVWAAP
jgi:uncharacterized protein